MEFRFRGWWCLGEIVDIAFLQSSIYSAVKKCYTHHSKPKLTEINLFNSDLDVDDVKFLCNNLNQDVKRLGIGHLIKKSVTDEHIIDLVSR